VRVSTQHGAARDDTINHGDEGHALPGRVGDEVIRDPLGDLLPGVPAEAILVQIRHVGGLDSSYAEPAVRRDVVNSLIHVSATLAPMCYAGPLRVI